MKVHVFRMLPFMPSVRGWCGVKGRFTEMVDKRSHLESATCLNCLELVRRDAEVKVRENTQIASAATARLDSLRRKR